MKESAEAVSVASSYRSASGSRMLAGPNPMHLTSCLLFLTDSASLVVLRLARVGRTGSAWESGRFTAHLLITLWPIF